MLNYFRHARLASLLTKLRNLMSPESRLTLSPEKTHPLSITDINMTELKINKVGPVLKLVVVIVLLAWQQISWAKLIMTCCCQRIPIEIHISILWISTSICIPFKTCHYTEELTCCFQEWFVSIAKEQCFNPNSSPRECAMLLSSLDYCAMLNIIMAQVTLTVSFN